MLVTGVGLLVFALIVAFARHGVRPDFSIFEITGGATPPPGEPLFVRIGSQLHDALTPRPFRITNVTSDGQALPFETSGHTPLLLKTTSTGQTLAIRIADRPTDLHLPVTSDPHTSEKPPRTSPMMGSLASPGLRRTSPMMGSLASPGLQRASPAKPTKVGPYHLDLIPSGGELVAGLPNRVFLRLLDASSAPLGDTSITLRHPALPQNPLELTTDRDGLATLTLLANRPNLDIQVRLPDAHEHTVALRPVGRELTVEFPPVARPGSTLRLHIASLRLRSTLSCELLRDTPAGPLWVHAFDHAFTDPHFELDLPIPRLPVGTRLDLQCALTPGVGLAWVSKPIHLGEPTDTLGPALAQTLDMHPRRPPLRLLTTRDTDREAAETDHGTTQTLLFVALASVLLALALFFATTIIAKSRATRLRITAALEDDTALSPSQRHSIARTRGVLYLAIGASLAVGWVAALVALFG